MGCAVQIHKSSEKREQMSSKCSSLMVLTMSPKHYWCHIVYVKSTRSDRVSDTVHFKHKSITNATINKPIPKKLPPPNVTEHSPDDAPINTPMPEKLPSTKVKEHSPASIKLQHLIRTATHSRGCVKPFSLPRDSMTREEHATRGG
jgi:hypothetical protein